MRSDRNTATETSDRNSATSLAPPQGPALLRKVQVKHKITQLLCRCNVLSWLAFWRDLFLLHGPSTTHPGTHSEACWIGTWYPRTIAAIVLVSVEDVTGPRPRLPAFLLDAPASGGLTPAVRVPDQGHQRLVPPEGRLATALSDLQHNHWPV